MKPVRALTMYVGTRVVLIPLDHNGKYSTIPGTSARPTVKDLKGHVWYTHNLWASQLEEHLFERMIVSMAVMARAIDRMAT